MTNELHSPAMVLLIMLASLAANYRVACALQTFGQTCEAIVARWRRLLP